jgi:cytochrome c2
MKQKIASLKVSAGLVIAAVALFLFSTLPAPASLPVATLAPAAVATTPPDLVAEGRALFRAKGCTTCHRHDAVLQVPSDSMAGAILGDIGAPNLTDYQPDPDFLRTWLKDPAAVRPGTWMPNLELKEWEIEALIAFLGSP